MTLIPALWEQRKVDSLRLRPPWSTKQVSEQPGLHRENILKNPRRKKEEEEKVEEG